MNHRPSLAFERLSKETVGVGSTEASQLEGAVTDQAGESLSELQQNDPEIGVIVKLRLQQQEQPPIDQLQLASECTKMLWSQWFRLVVKDNVVYRLWFSKNGEPTRMQLLAPQKLLEDIIKRSHGGMCGGHMGISRTCDLGPT